MDRRIWDEHIETMPPSELKRLEAPLIAEQIDYVYASKPYTGESSMKQGSTLTW